MDRFIEQFLRYILFRSLYRMIYQVAGPFGMVVVIAGLVLVSLYHRDIVIILHNLTHSGF